MYLAYTAVFWHHGQGPGGYCWGWKIGVQKEVEEEKLEHDEVTVKVSKCEEPASGVFFPLSVLKSSRDDRERGKCLNFQKCPGKAYAAQPSGRELTAVKGEEWLKHLYSKSYQNIPLTLFKVQGFYCQNPQAK